MGSTSTIRIDRPVAVVFDAVCDPTTYPEWLVGAQQIVDVDAAWPAIGSSFRHRVGWGPARVPGSTTVRALEPLRLLQLGAGMGPLGEALVTFRLAEEGDATVVSVEETPTRGVAGAAQRLVRPVVSAALWGRNQASLEMLARLLTND